MCVSCVNFPWHPAPHHLILSTHNPSVCYSPVQGVEAQLVKQFGQITHSLAQDIGENDILEKKNNLVNSKDVLNDALDLEERGMLAR